VLRPDLIREAETLEARAAQLRTDAKVIPDQFDSETPHDATGESGAGQQGQPQARRRRRSRRVRSNPSEPAIVANLNIANP
jgi:hypothetical protein